MLKCSTVLVIDKEGVKPKEKTKGKKNRERGPFGHFSFVKPIAAGLLPGQQSVSTEWSVFVREQTRRSWVSTVLKLLRK